MIYYLLVCLLTFTCLFFVSVQLYVRANFDYNPRDDKFIPTIDVGLEFRKGDVLKILNQDETHWWQVSTTCNLILTIKQELMVYYY